MQIKDALHNMHLFSKKESPVSLFTTWGETLNPDQVLQEYPRPQMRRDSYVNLNGYWDYTIKNKSKKHPSEIHGTILVPFSPESVLSGVNHVLSADEIMIYERILPVNDRPSEDAHCLLHFGAVNQLCHIYVNDILVLSHLGGSLPFYADITEYLTDQENRLSVHVKNLQASEKSSSHKDAPHLFPSGIWQTVWMEWVAPVHIADFHVTPLIDKETISVTIHLNAPRKNCCGNASATCYVYDHNQVLVSKSVCTNSSSDICQYSCYCDIDNMHLWTPEDPYLYTIKIVAGDDEVTGYFAMRDFSIELDDNGFPQFCLNHEPILLQGILNLGHWSDGLCTAPSDDAFIYDIQTIKSLGFNMIRMHSKIESARWYYHCDKLGMIVWQDMMASHNSPLFKRRTALSKEQFMRECQFTIQALAVFPCISTWGILGKMSCPLDVQQLRRCFCGVDNTRTIDIAHHFRCKGAIGITSEIGDTILTQVSESWQSMDAILSSDRKNHNK